LATENAVIPYGVGVDIGCRMCLSVFDIDPKELTQRKIILQENYWKQLYLVADNNLTRQNHEVMENELFYQLPLLKIYMEEHGNN
jgi:tRNA-splicing ligase RtcB